MPGIPVAIDTRPPRSIVLPVLGSIVVLAWIALWWLEQSPYGWLFHRHGGGAEHAHPGQTSGWLPAGAFLVGWLLMTVAMMLPTTVPLVSLFRRMITQRAHAALLLVLLLAGYLAAWLAFGVAALGLLWGIDQALASSLFPQAWIWGAGLFLIAGAFQFSTLKYACLDKCRSPLGFLQSHWHGRKDRTEALNIGWRHGVFCVGCCWALMLLMFAVGTTSLSWMLLLALVMAIEKNATWGQRLSHPLGVILLSAGVGIGLYNLTI